MSKDSLREEHRERHVRMYVCIYVNVCVCVCVCVTPPYQNIPCRYLYILRASMIMCELCTAWTPLPQDNTVKMLTSEMCTELAPHIFSSPAIP